LKDEQTEDFAVANYFDINVDADAASAVPPFFRPPPRLRRFDKR